MHCVACFIFKPVLYFPQSFFLPFFFIFVVCFQFQLSSPWVLSFFTIYLRLPLSNSFHLLSSVSIVLLMCLWEWISRKTFKSAEMYPIIWFRVQTTITFYHYGIPLLFILLYWTLCYYKDKDKLIIS